MSWAGAAVLALALVVTGLLARRLAARRLERLAARTATWLDDLALELLRRTHALVMVVLATAMAGQLVPLSPLAARAVRLLVVLALAAQVGIWASAAVGVAVEQKIRELRRTNPGALGTVRLLRILAIGLIWAAVGLVVLDTIGIDVTALVAGLGIGGIAIALALQSTLGDLLAALSILLDKPFEVGDFVVLEDAMGTVEQIGLKTTRLRSLSGEQIVLSNAEILRSRIRNYKRMQERRVVFRIGVTYQTSHGLLRDLPTVLRETVESQQGVRFDRAHFKSYGDFALTFEVVYYILSPDYNHYMDVQQQINLDVHHRLGQLGVEFAYPTQTLHLVPAATLTE